ncbi:MAG TPA: hemerythrin domain-containing protein [Methylomirabilota bacterium]|jgi:hemerythrin superfamily protein|nr:hemerythrin domain-containing protein [Methylomirabilota bacterium]
MKATALLKQDHAAVKKLLTQFGRTTARAVKTRERLAEKIATELEIHAQIEEELFYPAAERFDELRPLVDESREEHEQVKSLVAEMQGFRAGEEALTAKVRELRDTVLHHASEEEAEMFPKVHEHMSEAELEDLGERMRERKQALLNGMLARARRAVMARLRKVA